MPQNTTTNYLVRVFTWLMFYKSLQAFCGSLSRRSCRKTYVLSTFTFAWENRLGSVVELVDVPGETGRVLTLTLSLVRASQGDVVYTRLRIFK